MGSEVLHQGWLTKSPPLERSSHPFFKAAKVLTLDRFQRWRRRWFVLKEDKLPHQYQLLYFTDESRRRHKGTIDLNECDEVDSGLKTEGEKYKYDYMFTVKTPKRIYHFAVDSSEEMLTWVKHICAVCSLRCSENDNAANDSGFPDSKTPRTSETSNSLNISSPYILMSECITGPPSAPLRSRSTSFASYVNTKGLQRFPSDNRFSSISHLEEGDDSVFESTPALPPNRPPKPAHLNNNGGFRNRNGWSTNTPSISRELKPERKNSSSSDNYCDGFRSRTMGGSASNCLKFHKQRNHHHDDVIRGSRTTPRQWQARNRSVSTGDSTSSESFRKSNENNEQVHFYMLGPRLLIPAESYENKSVPYVELELPSSDETPKPLTSASTSNTIYKVVDFIKTEAFNRTREKVEAKYDDAQNQKNDRTHPD